MSANKPKFAAGDFAVMSYMKREFVLYPIEKNELSILARGYLSVHFGLAGISFGAFLTLFVTWATVALSEPVKSRFFWAFILSIVAFVYFGAMAARDYLNSKATIQGIHTQTTSVIVSSDK
jgi:hypothetical protein